MSTTKKHLITLMSNTNFSLNYETTNLEPQIEVILLTQEPVYKVNAKSEITKGVELGEFRFFSSLKGINEMIGELQAMAAQLQKFEQLSVGMNSIIEHAKKQQEKESKETPSKK